MTLREQKEFISNKYLKVGTAIHAVGIRKESIGIYHDDSLTPELRSAIEQDAAPFSIMYVKSGPFRPAVL